MNMKILVVGGGGREHAIASALARNSETEIFSVMAKRNFGIARIAKGVRLCSETDTSRILSYARETGVEYAFIGPEAPLEAGIVDQLESMDIGCVGPTRAAARIETDKAFCRDLMKLHAIDGCPKYRVFHDPAEAVSFINDQEEDLVIKPIGLTGGKGVRIMGEQVDRSGAVAYVKSLRGGVVLEERLTGEEFTLQAFVDGNHMVPMPLVQDHKRAFDGDLGPNTGGMGSYSMPDHMLPFVSDTDYKNALAIMRATIAALERTGHPYKGILYGQFMNTAKGPKVIEFNARFGDPEAMNVLSLLCSDLSDIMVKITNGSLLAAQVAFERKATVCKYIVPSGYPESPVSGDPITNVSGNGALLYYANVEEQGGKLFTLSSRALAFVGIGPTLEEAERITEQAASSVKGRVRYRRDIGTMALLERRIAHMRELR
ncbi:MAG: phosphoribosylamine--glycine ligase [Methanoregula sp.]|jgi:phosphoribosylamine--glycine ligase|nr:phosphoribosylamine--glycine ligase [Methanoregula sp.]